MMLFAFVKMCMHILFFLQLCIFIIIIVIIRAYYCYYQLEMFDWKIMCMGKIFLFVRIQSFCFYFYFFSLVYFLRLCSMNFSIMLFFSRLNEKGRAAHKVLPILLLLLFYIFIILLFYTSHSDASCWNFFFFAGKLHQTNESWTFSQIISVI